MFALVKKLWSDESGQGLVEYALIIALVAIGLIVALRLMRTNLQGIFQTINTTLANP